MRSAGNNAFGYTRRASDCDACDATHVLDVLAFVANARAYRCVLLRTPNYTYTCARSKGNEHMCFSRYCRDLVVVTCIL